MVQFLAIDLSHLILRVDDVRAEVPDPSSIWILRLYRDHPCPLKALKLFSDVVLQLRLLLLALQQRLPLLLVIVRPLPQQIAKNVRDLLLHCLECFW